MVIAKSHLDLRDSGQQCGVNRVWRLMKRVGIKAQVGYRSPRARKGEASIVVAQQAPATVQSGMLRMNVG
ncbi:transposase insF for insertion sequence IS3A/B/C/D/E/fA [Escherichia coli]|nr:transposase insF for insertion sequence IS3A/B/C/D/E/fA [Escherichia coli]